MAQYAVQLNIAGDPVFAWWIRHVFAKCNRIFGNIKPKYCVRMHKFGVKIPKSVQEFYRYVEEVFPENIPVARCNFMLTHFFVDANHAGDTEKICSL